MLHKDVPRSTVFTLNQLVRVVKDQIVSFPVMDEPGISIVLLGLAEGESISTEYTLAGKWLHVLEGKMEVTSGGRTFQLNSLDQNAIWLPPGVSHDLLAVEATKLLQIALFDNEVTFQNNALSIKEEQTMSILINKIPHSETLILANQIEVVPNQTASKALVQRKDLTISLFALDKDGVIAKHTTPGDALVQVLEGTVEITIGDNVYLLNAGESIVMPAHIPHALKAVSMFKMLLTVVKEQA